METEFTEIPDKFTRFSFGLIRGLRSYSPVMRIKSSFEPTVAIRFYECLDRRRQQRKLVYATDPKQDGGYCFLVQPDDFSTVSNELAKLDKESTGEQGAPPNP